MHATFEDFVLKVTAATAITSQTLIQKLWSDYGQILRCQLKEGTLPAVILKWIQLPAQQDHPKGWNTNIGHQRKVKSYEVEQYWYAHYANSRGRGCRVPKCLGITHQGEEVLLVLEDLNPAGFPLRKTQLKLMEVRACLDWLAHFHAQFMQCEPLGLWAIGTYWHLATRPDELAALTDKRLQQAAPLIDQKLELCTFKTWVHGDAKLANFCFSETDQQVAAVDFQYVGGGCGMKDIAYFMGSCLTDQELEQHTPSLLNFYFTKLGKTLSNKTFPIQAIEQEWRALYPFAVADFHRFLKGWSPQHWKINSYSEQITQKVVQEVLDLP